MVGTQLGPYRVLAALGAGGMGEVYRARDDKLHRDVALKILPSTFASDPDRLTRFTREAQLLAALNHPNIGRIYGFEDSTPTHALVLELIEGPTLAHRLAGGSLGPAEALPLARQIAMGLEYAHERGVVHRDLKPGNIKVTSDGTAMILDFGLATALEIGAPAERSEALTTSLPLTESGVVLGTPAYMPPEQALGREVDRRADIWAFGCVLFEMLTGTRAFGGKTVTETLAAVIRDPPDWSRLPVTTPSDVRTLVQRCLRKDPRQRLQAIGDARVVLDDVLSGAPDILPTAREAPRKRRLILELAGAALVAAIAALAVWALKPTAATAPPIRSFTVALPAGQQLASLDRGALAFSDEGNLLAYVAALDSGRGQQIYIRAMDSGATRPILGTEGGSMPFFSPDGDWLGFLAGGRLKKVPLKGGPIAMLTDAPSALGATWSRQHTIVFASLWSVLQQIPEATGGTVKALTQFAGTENSHAWPQTVADSGAVLFTSAGPDTRVVAIGDLTSGVHRDLIAGRGIIAPGYVRSGHLVYLQDNNLMAVPLDLAHRAVEGDPVLAVQRVRQYAVSSTGSLAYVSAGSPDGRSRLTWVSRSGVAEVVDDRADNLYQPRLDPVAGKRIAVDLNSQVWIFDLTTHNWTPFTFGGLNQHAVWTKDGNELVFMMQKGRTWQLARQAADGSGQPEAVMSDTGLLDIPYSVMPDGSIGVVKYSGTAESQFWVLPTHKSTVGTRPMRIFSIPIADAEAGPAFSPDGHWLAYAASDASGQRQIYVQAYPEKGAKHQISIDGGNEPVWNPDDRHGLELFYRNGDDMMAAEITTTPDFRQGRPHRLFAGASDYRSVAPNYVRPNYDFSAGDQRFLMLQAAGRKDTPATEIHVVLNWSEDLKRLAPAARTQ